MKKILIPFLLIFSTAIASASELKEAIVQVYLVSGDVTLIDTNNGETRPLARGDLIGEGYAIETQKASSALLLFSNGSSINVTPESYIDISEFSQEPFQMSQRNYALMTADPSPSKTTLDLHYGKIVGNVRKLDPQSSYTLNSPTGSAGIRGTTFVFATLTKGQASLVGQNALTAAEASLSVGEGTVILEINGQQYTVNEGESITVPVQFADGTTGELLIQAVGEADLGDITADAQGLIDQANQQIQDGANDTFLVSPGGELFAIEEGGFLPLPNDPDNLDNLNQINVTNSPS